MADSSNYRVQEFTTAGTLVRAPFAQKADGGLATLLTIASDPTKHNLYVADSAANSVSEFKPSGEAVTSFGSSGSGPAQFSGAVGVAVSSSGAVYVGDRGNKRVDVWPQASAGAHTTRMIYYSAAANSSFPSCGGHPEWADLPCQTQPAVQPGTPGVPSLPVSTVTYNIWDSVETASETFGSTASIPMTTPCCASPACF